MPKETIEMLIEGGNAKPGPTTAPKFAALKVNMGEIFQKINEQTKEYKGMSVPVKVIVEDGSFLIEVGVPPVASLIKKELGLQKFSIKKKEGDTEKKESEEKEKKSKEGEKKAEKKGKEEGRKPEKKEKVIMGNLTIDQCIKVAKMKGDSLLAKTLKGAVKEVVGSCISMPILIENKQPKEILEEIDKGIYDDKF